MEKGTLNLYLDHLTNGVIFFDPEGRILYANQAAVRLLKRPLSEIVGSYCYEVIHGAKVRPPFCLQTRLLLEEGDWITEDFFEPYLRSHLCVHASVVRDEKGHILGFFHLIRVLKSEEKRSFTHELSKLVVETLPGFFYLSDAQYRILAVNRRFREWMGLDPLGKLCYEAISQRDNPCPWCKREEVFEKGRTIEWEIRNPRDGRWYHVVNAPCDLPSGERLRLSLIFDIHEKKLLENKLRELFEHNPVGISVTDLEGRIIMANRALRDLLGLSLEDLGQASALYFYERPEDRQELLKALKSSGGKIESYELSLKDKKGRRHVFLVSSKIYPEKGEIWTSFQEITLLKKAQRALAESEARFKVLAESTPLAVLLVNERDEVIYCNPAAEDLFGCSREQIEKNPFRALLGEENHAKYRSFFRQIFQEDFPSKNIHFETEILKNGLSLPVEIFLSSVKVEGEKFLLALVRDLSERKALEEERLRHEKYHSLELLAGGVAHDFNNLLTALMINLDVLEILVREKKARGILERTKKIAFQAKDLARELLFFSKGDIPRKEEVEVEAFLRELVSFLVRGAPVRLHLEIPSSLPLVRIDPVHFTQVVQNLVINALEAMQGGGELFVRAKAEGNFLLLEIKDTGSGIPEGIRQRIFEPGFTTKEKGSGLGLAVVKSIVERAGGRIEYFSTPEKGTTFKIYLPVTKRKEESRKEETPAEGVWRLKGRVLLMDDERSLRLLLSEALDYLGVEVETAVEGEDALRKYKEALFAGRPFDLLILDLTVPGGKGGLWVAERIREMAVNPRPRLILATGYSFKNFERKRVKELFDDIIYKPFTLKEFQKLLGKFLSKKRDFPDSCGTLPD